MQGRMIREVVFGVNDGLVTAFGFVAGVSGAHIKPFIIFVTGLAQALAGAISMFFGAYLSTKAQQDFFRREIAREKREIETEPEREADEIRDIYREKGFTPEEIEMIVKRLTADKNRLLSFMVQEELGITPESFDSPVKLGVIIGISFLIGALIPVLPYTFVEKGLSPVAISSILTLISLFAVGLGKGKFTKTSWVSSGFEMLIIGIIAGGIGYGAGKLMSLFGLSAAP